MEAVGRVAKELGITRIRKPMENLRDSWASTRHETSGRTKELIAAAAARAVTPWFQTIARKYGLLSPDYFLGLAMTGGLGPAALRRMIDTPVSYTHLDVYKRQDEDVLKTSADLIEKKTKQKISPYKVEITRSPDGRCV